MGESKTSSVNNDSFSPELVSKFCTDLPKERSSNMTEFEYCLFLIFSTLSPNGNGYSVLFIICSIVLWVQSLACMSLTVLALIVYKSRFENLEPDFVTKFYYFILRFRTLNSSNQIIPSYLYTINILSLLCIISFFLLLFQMNKRVHIPPALKLFYTVFVVYLPQFLIVILSTVFFEFVLLSESYRYAIQAFLVGIYFLFFAYLQLVFSRTMYSSIFYFSGIFITSDPSSIVLFVNTIIIFCYQVCHALLEKRISDFFTSASIIMIGVIFIALCIQNFYVSTVYPAFILTHGFVLIIAGLIGVFQTKFVFKNDSIIYLIIFWSYLLIFAISYIIFSSLKKKALSMLISAKMKFKKLNIASDIKFLFFVNVGFEYGLDFVLDGTFIEYGLKKAFINERCQIILLYLMSFLPNPPEIFNEIRNNMMLKHHPFQHHRYIMFEVDKLCAMHMKGEVPKDLVNTFNNFESRLILFQQMRTMFITEIAHDSSACFVFLNALANARDIILNNYANRMIEAYPNCPDVIRLYAQYLSIACQNGRDSNMWLDIADDLQKKVIPAANFTPLNILYSRPRLQLEVLKDRNPGLAPITLSKPRVPSILQFPALGDQRTSKSDDAKINSHFSNKKVAADIILKILMLIMFFFVILFYIISFGLTNESIRLTRNGYTFFRSYIRYCNAYSAAFYDPIYYMYKMSATREEVNTMWIDYIAEYAFSWNDFFDNFSACNIESKMFYDSFRWITTKTYEIPSYNTSRKLNATMEFIIPRFQNLISQIFPFNSSYVEKAVEIPILCSTFSVSYSIFIPFYKSFLVSYDNYMDSFTSKITNEIAFTLVPPLICYIVIMILPIFVYFEIHKMAKIFPKNQTEKDLKVINHYLSQDFRGFKQIYLEIILLAILSLLSMSATLLSTKALHVRLRKEMLEETGTTVMYSHALFAATTAYIDMLLTQINVSGFEVNIAEKIEEINHCLLFMVNGSYREISYVTLSAPVLKLVDRLVFQVNGTDVQYDEESTLNYKKIFFDEFYPLVTRSMDRQSQVVEDSFIFFETTFTNINLLFFVVTVILGCIITHAVYNLHITLQMLIDLLSTLRESSILHLMEQNFKRLSIIDLVKRPCAIIDSSKRIIAANQLWLSFYDETFDSLIGRSIGETENESKYSTYPISEDQRMIVMKEIKEEKTAKNELENIIRDLHLLKSVSIPKRFLDVKRGTRKVGFLVVCSISLIPNNSESIEPQVWVNDVTTMETWINERCQTCEDVDILFGSVRQIQLIFGVNEKCDGNRLVLSAMNISVDLLRWAIEWEWASGDMNICIAISCGSPNWFVFQQGDFTRMDNFGGAFDKQMRLRELAELNSIVVCEEIEEKLRLFRVGCEMAKVADDAFLFMVKSNASE